MSTTPTQEQIQTKCDQLRAAIDDIGDKLCLTVDGQFDLAVTATITDESVEKLAMMVNFVLDAARRNLSEVTAQNARLTELDKLKSEFLANVSHELRTPLTLILGPLDTLLGGGESLSPDAREELLRMQRNAARLTLRVNDLLDFTKLEAGKVEVNWRAVHVRELVSQLVDDMRPTTESRKIALALKADPSLDYVPMDRRMFEKIVLNLVGNAMKFTPEGGRIDVELRPAADDMFELVVSDTGPGIPKDKLGMLFRRFQQVDASATRKHEGTGLGLALVREFAGLMGGNVGVESEVGKGARFSVRLPRGADRVVTLAKESGETANLPQHAMGLAAEAPRADAPRDPSRPTLLLAEDNPDMRGYVANLLSSEYHVVAVENGRLALEAARREPPDIIVSDVMMPEMDGFQLVKRLKEDERLRPIPVILLTARADQEGTVVGLEGGADDYLCKPFSPAELRARVRAARRTYSLYQDIERKNDELTKLQKRLVDTLAQLSDLEDLCVAGQVVTDMAVKLRTPLSRVLSRLESNGAASAAGVSVEDVQMLSSQLKELELVAPGGS